MGVAGKLRGGALIRAQPSFYTAGQAIQYLKRVGWREGTHTAQNIDERRFPANYENLATLVRRHLLTFSMDNSEMHYPEAIFKRMVTDALGGSYCYGHNTLLLGVLRALGYRAYTSIARMDFTSYGGPGYSAFSHMTILVQLGEFTVDNVANTWLVDVSPGPPSPMLPMPLAEDSANILPGATPGEENILTRAFHRHSSLVVPGQTVESGSANGDDYALSPSPSPSSYTASQAKEVFGCHAVWQLEYRAGKDTPIPDFRSVYRFVEEEYFQPDFDWMHYTNMYKPFADVFWNDVLAGRYVLADEDDEDDKNRKIYERPLSKLSLFRGVMKRRIGLQVIESVRVDTEEVRVAVLKKYFGIIVDEKDIVHIKGRDAAIEKVQRVDHVIA